MSAEHTFAASSPDAASTLWVRGGTVVTASDVFEADILVVGETIRAIGKDLSPGVMPDKTLDATGCYVFPGGIDPHTHLDMPFMGTASSDDFDSGTLAALHGGTTTIIDFAIQKKGDSLRQALETWHAKAAGKARCDYAFHVIVTDYNDAVGQEIPGLIENEGVTSFKTFMAYKNALMIDDRQLLGLLSVVHAHGGLVTTHAENGDMIDTLTAQLLYAGHTGPKYHAVAHPIIAESEATGRMLDLAHLVGAPVYIVHMTAEASVDKLRAAHQRQQLAYGETCIQYLLLDDSVYDSPGFEAAKWVFSPPLRKRSDCEALWTAIQQGVLHTVGTDHCPFCMDQKRMGLDDFSKIPNGVPAIEHRMELLFSEGVLTGRLSLPEYVRLTSANAARIFGLAPKKGAIAVGADADLLILDPVVQHTISAATHHQNVDYSAFEGWQVTGKTRSVVLRGEVVIEDGTARVSPGFGRYCHRLATHGSRMPLVH
jgi:dihydropyrimidinase